MPSPENIISVVGEWVHKAENDLKTAAHTLSLGSEAPTDTICFHVQQCVEKYLKAVLVLRMISFAKTHDLSVLMNLIPDVDRPALEKVDQNRLTKYAVAIRYSDAGIDIALAEARKAVAIARRVRKEVRRLLPKETLRRKKK